MYELYVIKLALLGSLGTVQTQWRESQISIGKLYHRVQIFYQYAVQGQLIGHTSHLTDHEETFVPIFGYLEPTRTSRSRNRHLLKPKTYKIGETCVTTNSADKPEIDKKTALQLLEGMLDYSPPQIHDSRQS